MINEGSFYTTQPNVTSSQDSLSFLRLNNKVVQHVSELKYCIWNTFEIQLTVQLLLIKIIMYVLCEKRKYVKKWDRVYN